MQEAWKILCEREHARIGYSAPSYYPTPEHSFYSTARSVKHRASNRYNNILAYDRTAVLSSSGYLNANIVSDGRQWWVASQAPTPQTFPVFFQAIYERRASEHPLLSGTPTGGGRGGKVILVQLTGWEENGMIKADRYLSSGSFGDIALEMGEETWREDIQAKVTHFKLNELEVLHYHFEAWPDHGVPEGEDVEALRRLVLEIERIREGEVWVHCSAGVGRTGTFIALASLLVDQKGEIPLQESPMGPLPKSIQGDKVAVTVDQLREWRGMLVQSAQQFMLLYQMTRRK